jgi:hypothetical protein
LYPGKSPDETARSESEIKTGLGLEQAQSARLGNALTTTGQDWTREMGSAF